MKANQLRFIPRFQHAWQYTWRLLLDASFPSVCNFCQARIGVKDDLSICRKCKQSLVSEDIPVCNRCAHPLKQDGKCPSCAQSTFGLDNYTCAFFYQGLGKQLIKAYKFDKRLSYAKTIADLCVTSKGDFLRQFDVIVPVTLAKRDYFERDFCPVLSVCKPLAKKLNLRILRPIVKLPKKIAQHAKNMEERKKGVFKQYRVLPKKMQLLKGKKVLIIDDVCTTGATLDFFHQSISPFSPKEIGAFSFVRTVFQ